MDTNNTATTATGRLPVTVVDVATGRITADSCLCGGPPILRLGRVWVGVVRLTLCGEPWPIPDGASFRLRMTDTDKARHYESRPVRGDGPGDIVATVDLGADPYPYKAGQGWLEIDMDNRVVMSDKVVLRGPLATPSSSLDGVPVVVVADGVLALSGVPTVYQMPPIPAGQAEAGLRVIPAGVPRAYRLSFHSDAPSLLLSVDGAAVTGEYAGPGWYCADVTEDGDGNVTVSYARMAATDPTAAWLPCRYGVEVVAGDWPLHGRPGTLYVHAVTRHTRVWRDGEWYDLSGQPGATPCAGPNGNWFINGSDTGVRARAEDAYIDRVRLTMGMLSPDTQDDDADPATMWRGTVPGYAVAASFHETPASPLPTVYHTRMSYDPAMALSSVWLTQGEVDHIAAMPPGKDVLILDVLDKVTPLMVIPHIDPVTGNWVIGSEDTGRRATGSSLAIIDGEWAIDGVATGELAFLEWLGDLAGPPADGRRGQAYRDGALGEVMVHDGDSWAMMARDGYTPYIEDGEWHIAGEPIGVPATGPANTLSIGTVAKGDDAQATITGTAPSQTLNLTLPKGDTGPANTLSIGTVAKGDEAQVTITGTSPNQTLNLTLPKGDPNTLSIGLVTKGLTPQATITGTAPNQVLGLVLPQGDTGPATTLSIGTVTKGDEAQATITGTPPDQTLSLVLPKGDVGATGPANTLAIGTVTKGENAQATITGTAPNQTLNLTLPKGDPNTLSIGTVTQADTPAATITGEAPNQTLNLVLPKGDKGDTGLSSYEDWLDEGHEGTREDYLEWLQDGAGEKIENKTQEIDAESPSEVKYPSEKAFVGFVSGEVSTLNIALGGKVDKVEGKVLSDNNFTTAEKNKLESALTAVPDASTTVKGAVQIATGEEVTTGEDTVKAVVPSTLKTELDKKVDKETGKVLSDNNFTTAEKNKLESALTSVPDASESVKGILMLASAAEAAAGLDTSKAIVSATLKTELDKKESTANKATDFSTVNHTKYPSVEAVKNFAQNETLTELTGADVTVAPWTQSKWSASGACTLTATGWAESGVQTSEILITLAAGSTPSVIGAAVSDNDVLSAAGVYSCFIRNEDGVVRFKIAGFTEET